MKFWKGHALGNDYIVLDRTGAAAPEPSLVRALCDRHRGVGGDGVLVADRGPDTVALRIFNPDGSEAEKSGNGLRIFGAWLHAQGHAPSDAPFHVALPAERVEMRVESRAPEGALMIRVDMGRARFLAGDIPFTDAAPDHEVQARPLDVEGGRVEIHLVSMGNPHCVVFVDDLDPDQLHRLGPAIQAHPAFERGVNVQLARPTAPDTLEALIWERGAGETLASGSSACAATAAALRTGRLQARDVVVSMPGGQVRVQIAGDWSVTLTGTAEVVVEGEWLREGKGRS
jgi:diaminopimelate epimerase